MKSNHSSIITLGIITILSSLFMQKIDAQKQVEYFQQEVNSVINVNLDDNQHRLTGTIYIEYTNNSPEILDSLYFHLWANAYQSKNSAFSEQKLLQKDASFYFAKDEMLGGYDSLEFFIEGKRTKWDYSSKHRDIAYLKLEKALFPGKTISITAPFELQIPGPFSRFGHDGQSYQITQWFPKPAVYDKDGWHPMPYLDMGEFYSEFGDYDVTITLPENYFVSATGLLSTNSELRRIEERIAYTESLPDSLLEISGKETTPASSIKTKSIRFSAENVHDFAWFADKRFLIKEKEITLLNNHKVKGQVFYLPSKRSAWKESLEYLERGLRFYSELVGPYPYPKAAAVEGALKAGGGMEYPMVTVISVNSGAQSLDEVIIHEVGHNWFYGILASNEREHPWIDEGINSYYDHRYTKTFYKNKEIPVKLPYLIKNLVATDWASAYHSGVDKKALSQASSNPSEAFCMNNYFLGAYQNPAMAFRYLEKYLGTANFDRIMKTLYQNWAFKHLGPDDIKKHFENESTLNLDWFFDGMIGDTRVFDYGFKDLEKSEDGYLLKIQNKTGYKIPVQLSGMSKDSLVLSQWIEGFSNDTTVNIDAVNIDHFVLDKRNLYSELDRSDNFIKTSGLFRKNRPVSLRFLDVIDNPAKRQIAWLPSIAWNQSDGIMAGIMLFNTSFPKKGLEYFIHPMYAFGLKGSNLFSEKIVGQAKISYDWYQNRTLRNIKLSLSAKSFHSYRNPAFSMRYIALTPELKLILNKQLNNQHYYEIIFRSPWVSKELINDVDTDNRYLDAIFPSISFIRKDQRIINPINTSLTMEYGSFENSFSESERYLKAFGDWSTKFLYAQDRTIFVRLYGGAFIWRSKPKSTITKAGTLGLIGYADNDYTYSDFYFDRGTQDGGWSNQINMTGGAFKTAVSTAYNLGQSNSYLASLNLKADMPYDIPVLNSIKPFFDFGVYAYLPTLSEDYQNKFLYSGGIMIESLEGVLNLYLPLINSKEINNIYKEEGNFLQRMSFSMNLNLFNFSKLLDRDDLLFGQ